MKKLTYKSNEEENENIESESSSMSNPITKYKPSPVKIYINKDKRLSML